MIISIVLLHSYAMAFGAFFGDSEPGTIKKLLDAVSHWFLHDTTIFFAIISGILYAQVFHQRGAISYLKSRFLNFIDPYIIFTILLSLYTVDLTGTTSLMNTTDSFYEALPRNLFFGTARFHFCYIPVLVVLFLVSPLVYRLLNLRNGWLFGTLLIALPIFVSRKGLEFSYMNVFYFAGPYVLGMYAGRDPIKAVQFASRHIALAAITALVSTIILVVLYAVKLRILHGVNLKESVFYLQKISVFSLLSVLVYRNEKRLAGMEWLNATASYAFGIYLLHVPLIEMFLYFSYALISERSILNGAIITIASAFVGVLVSIFFVRVIKSMTGSRSRLVVGC